MQGTPFEALPLKIDPSIKFLLNTLQPDFSHKGKSTFELMCYIKSMITACMLFFTISAVAQSQPTKVVADKIAGIVGDRIIPVSYTHLNLKRNK